MNKEVYEWLFWVLVIFSENECQEVICFLVSVREICGEDDFIFGLFKEMLKFIVFDLFDIVIEMNQQCGSFGDLYL